MKTIDFARMHRDDNFRIFNTIGRNCIPHFGNEISFQVDRINTLRLTRLLEVLILNLIGPVIHCTLGCCLSVLVYILPRYLTPSYIPGCHSHHLHPKRLFLNIVVILSTK